MIRVSVNPTLINWARKRAGYSQSKLAHRFRKLPEWETGEVQPTLKQLENFANAVHVPLGFLFLSEPPQESVPIPDFRTVAGRGITRPSPNLLDTIYACQERQSWYRSFARVEQHPEIKFVNSVTIGTPPRTVAARMSDVINFELTDRRECPSWTEALRLFTRRLEDAGVLVMINSVVGSNTHRRLDPEEFRGFALCDTLAPLIFVNGADTRAARMFTLAHEFAHLWLGQSALSDCELPPHLELRSEEVWCNAVAAEFLVPLAALQLELRKDELLTDTLSRLTRIFKVSRLVILRRLLDANWLNHDRFTNAWEQEIQHLRILKLRESDWGDFYRTTASRVSRRFAHALVVNTLEGHTLYRDAYRMLGISKIGTFDKLGREVEVIK